MSKLIKYLAMLVFIALPFIGFYLGTQYQKIRNAELERSTDFSNWITYQNEEYAFHVDYPPSYRLSGTERDRESISPENADFIQITSDEEVLVGKDYGIVNPDYYIEIDQNISSITAFQDLFVKRPSYPADFVKIGEVRLGNNTWITYFRGGEVGETGAALFHNNAAYFISTDYGSLDRVLDIASTFAFEQ